MPINTIKKDSIKEERRISKKVGFKLTPGSGNLDWPSFKGDGTTDNFVIECKSTENKNFLLKEDILKKIYREASIAGKEAVVIMSLKGIKPPTPKDWVLINVELFKELLEIYEKNL